MSSIAWKPVRDVRPVLVPMIVLGTLGLAALTGQGWLPVDVTFVPIMVLVVAGSLAVVTRLDLGVALLPFVAAAIPWSVGTGTQSPLVAGFLFALFLVGLWVFRAVLTRQYTIQPSPVIVPGIALMLVWILSYVYSNAVRPPLVVIWPTFTVAQLGGLSVLLLSVLVLFVSIHAGRDVKWIKIATWSLIGLGLIVIVTFYLQIWFIVNRIQALGLFTLWVVALSFGQALFNTRLRRWLRIGLLAFDAAWIYKALILQALSFTGWVPMLVAVLAITWLRSKRAFVLVLLAGALFVALNRELVLQIVYYNKVSEGDTTRGDIWLQQLKLIEAFPVLGTGPAGYAVYNVNLFAESPYSMSTHSNYVDVVDQTGIVGAVIFLWFLASLLVVCWRANKQWHTGFEGGFTKAVVGGYLGVIVAMSLGDWFIPFVYNDGIAGVRQSFHAWVFLGLLAGMVAFRGRRSDASSVATRSIVFRTSAAAKET